MVRPPFCLVLVGLLAGCGASDRVTGTWCGTDDTIVASGDGTFVDTQKQFKFGGTWSASGDDVTFNLSTIDGQDVGTFRRAMGEKVSGPTWDKWFEDVGKPSVFKLDGDGNHMTRDQSRDPGHPTVTYAKY